MTNHITLSRPHDRLLKTATNDDVVSGFASLHQPNPRSNHTYVGRRSGSLAYAISPQEPDEPLKLNGREFMVYATLWSYGAAVATVVRRRDSEDRLVIVSDGEGYCLTTKGHLGRVRGRVYNRVLAGEIATAPTDLLMPVANQITSSLASATDILTAALRARTYPGYKLAAYEEQVLNARKIAAFFNFEQYIDAPAPHRVPGTLNDKQTARLVALRLNGTSAILA